MPIIHNESFDESDPFQLRKHGFYDMEGGPPIIETASHTTMTPQSIVTAAHTSPLLSTFEEPPPGKPELEIARFVAYWTPERRAQRVAEELS